MCYFNKVEITVLVKQLNFCKVTGWVAVILIKMISLKLIFQYF